MSRNNAARATILARIRRPAAPTPAKPLPWSSRRHFPDLAQRFQEALEAAHGEVVLAGSLEEALEAVSQFLQETGARRVALNQEPPLTGINFIERWPTVEWGMVGDDGLDLRAFCAVADVGLSSAAAALAETGSLVVSSGPERSRLVTLLPPVHLALVPVTCLTSDLFTWIASGPRPFPANVTIISGPSKTADIEQTLSIGVHGPGRLVVILYE